ncbi:MAG: hypothetical protein ABS75_02655 [Pelagibacterium sp. SCN 63-23]|nr:MAG: hypothetical protein ABS75_02655 [Pelagibacterium sp. SCN 63-23]
MTLYALYQSRLDAALPPVAIGERFCWFAALLPPIHALVHRLWGQLALFGAGLLGIVLFALVFGSDIVFWLYIVLALAVGFAAPGARRAALARRHDFIGYRFAADADLARIAMMEARA